MLHVVMFVISIVLRLILERQREKDLWGLPATYSSLLSKLETKRRWAAFFKMTAEVVP